MAHGDRRRGRRRGRLHADAGDLARDPDAQRAAAARRRTAIVITPSHNPPEDGGFKYNPPHGGPADTDVTRQIQDAANELLRAGVRGVERLPLRGGDRARATPRLPRRVRRRPVGGRRPGRDRGRRAPARCRPAGRRERRVLGGDRRPLPARPRGRQRPGRSDVLVHAARPRRQDPDGLLLAGRDGGPDLAQGPLRRRLRQRPRRRPPRDRHPRGGAAEPEPLPGGGDRVPVRRRRAATGRADAGVGKTMVSSSIIDRVVAGLGRRLEEVPVGFKWFVAGLLDGTSGVRRRGERGRELPAPRRHARGAPTRTG